MEFLRVKISALVSSFRHPNIVVGFQPTLSVPPPTTVLGLISSAVGRIVSPKEIKFGYLFFFQAKARDLEFIYELTAKQKLIGYTNVVLREFLYKPELYLYLDRLDFSNKFLKPEFPLLLGRTQELARVDEVKIVKLEKRKNVRFGHAMLPFNFPGVAGPVVGLPLYFEYNGHRIGRGNQPFVILDRFIKNYSATEVWFDEEMNWGIFIYGEK